MLNNFDKLFNKSTKLSLVGLGYVGMRLQWHSHVKSSW